MIIKLKILASNFAVGALILFGLCLGSQNLNQRHSINLGITETAPLPVGFIVGVSLIAGIISGGTLTSIIIKERSN